MTLREITKQNGLTLKQLSSSMEIPYTTLRNLSQQSIIEWDPSLIVKAAKALEMDKKHFIDAVNGDVLAPFIKWVGGKRQLLPELMKYVPINYCNYFEPFVGGGALLWRLRPDRAFINDYNEELTNTYKVVKTNIVELVKQLWIHQQNDSKPYYLALRSADRDGRILKMTSVQRAARFIYLNKAGYNGLWRVNSHGQNNVPYGSHKQLNLVPKTLESDHQYLHDYPIEITTGDYRDSVSVAQKNDFVYFDPPYVPVNTTSTFTTYTKNGFGLIQQKQLRDTALVLARSGVNVMLSNSNTELVHELYENPRFNIHHVQAMRYVNSVGKKRGKVGEVIITTY